MLSRIFTLVVFPLELAACNNNSFLFANLLDLGGVHVLGHSEKKILVSKIQSEKCKMNKEVDSLLSEKVSDLLLT